MKAGKKGKFQGNSKMVPGAPVGFRVGSLDMGGGVFGQKTQNRRKKWKQWKQASEKNQKNWLQSSLGFGNFWDRAN